MRIAIISLMCVAWFALSNHCLLAACAKPAAVAKGCPMHTKSSSEKAPPKQGKSSQPCCKTLPAVPVAKAKATPKTLDFVVKPFFKDAVLSLVPHLPRSLVALDTGPPEARSFPELVLQRSILAHAPPLR